VSEVPSEEWARLEGYDLEEAREALSGRYRNYKQVVFEVIEPSASPGTPAAASNVDPIVLQALEDVKGSLIKFRDEHGWPNVPSATKSKNPLILDNYIEVPLYSFQYTSQQLQAYDDIFPEHAGDRVMWLPDETKLGKYQMLYKMKRERVGTYILQEYWRFNRLLTRYAELMGFVE